MHSDHPASHCGCQHSSWTFLVLEFHFHIWLEGVCREGMHDASLSVCPMVVAMKWTISITALGSNGARRGTPPPPLELNWKIELAAKAKSPEICCAILPAVYPGCSPPHHPQRCHSHHPLCFGFITLLNLAQLLLPPHFPHQSPLHRAACLGSSRLSGRGSHTRQRQGHPSAHCPPPPCSGCPGHRRRPCRPAD